MLKSVFVLMAQLSLAAQVALLTQPSVFGYWEGVIRLPGIELSIQVTLVQEQGQEPTGSISIPAQGLKNFRLGGIALAESEISFNTPGVPGNPTFKGRIEGETIKGDFTQSGHTFGFELKRVAETKPTVVEATLPKVLSEREITVGTSPWELPGTLTLPEGGGPFSAVVLVHGSGPHDRDARLGDTYAFRDIAWGLAEAGIAVIRYDKRTLVHGAKCAENKNFTLNDETVDDAVLAVKLATQIKEINAKKLFVVGHSLGGYALGRIGKKAPNAAGFVSLAGPARPMEDLLLEQVSTKEPPEHVLLEFKKAVAKVKSKDLTLNTPASELPLGIPPSYFLDMRGYDPVAELRKTERPALILHGDEDIQVTMTDFALWKKGHPKATHMSFPKLNHSFMPVLEGKKSGPEYGLPGQRVAPEVIQAIADWIKTR